MSEVKVNKISPRSGTAFTLGDSGDTFTVPSGATLTTTNATVNLPASVGGLGTGIDVTSQITGVVPAANLGTGTASSSTVLYGDGTYKAEPGGAHTLLATQNAADDAVIEFLADIDSTYRTYLVTINNLIPETDGTVVSVQIYVAGAYKTDAYYNYGNNVVTSGGSHGAQAHQTDDHFRLHGETVGNGTGENFNGEIKFWTPSDTTEKKFLQWNNCFMRTDGEAVQITGAGYYNNGEAAFTGLKIYMDSDNITSGQFKLYGVV